MKKNRKKVEKVKKFIQFGNRKIKADKSKNKNKSQLKSTN